MKFFYGVLWGCLFFHTIYAQNIVLDYYNLNDAQHITTVSSTATDIDKPHKVKCLEPFPFIQSPHEHYYLFNHLHIPPGETLSLCRQVESGQDVTFGAMNIVVLGKLINEGTIDVTRATNVAASNLPLAKSNLPHWLSNAINTLPTINLQGSPGLPGGLPGASPEGATASMGFNGADGPFGGHILQNGLMGGVGGDGGRGANGMVRNIGITSQDGGNGGSTLNNGGLGGRGAGGLVITAHIFINTGKILAHGKNGGDGQNGLRGDRGDGGRGGHGGGYHNHEAHGGGRGHAYANAHEIGPRLCASKANTGEVHGGGGGAGGRGAGGGGGGGGYVIIKAERIVMTRGLIDVRGGRGGQGGTPGLNGVPENRQIDYCWRGIKNIGPYNEAVAIGGAGGGGGGGGGNGGRGMDGVVKIIHGTFPDAYLTSSSFNIQGHTDLISIGGEDQGALAYGFEFHTALKQNEGVLNNWLNLNGTQEIQQNQFNWFYVNRLQVPVHDFSRSIYYFPIKSASYRLRSSCNGAYEKVFPLQNQEYENLYFVDYHNNNQNLVPLTGSNFIHSLNSNFIFPYNNNVNDITNNHAILPFQLCNGINYVDVHTRTKAETPSTHSLSFLVDQYAPCDKQEDEAFCNIQFINKTSSSDYYNQTFEHATHGKNIEVQIQAYDSNGSGIYKGNNHQNMKFFLFKQVENSHTGSTLHVPGDVTLPIHVGVSNTHLRDLSCDKLLDENNANRTVLGQPAYEITWDNASESYQDNVAVTLDLSHPKYTDGTYWVGTCFQDKAGNWSRFMDPENSSLLEYQNPNVHWEGRSNIYYLSLFNAFNFKENFHFTNYTHNHPSLIKAYFPHLHKRFVLDSPIIDDPACTQDPCSALQLSINPGYTLEGETNVYVAYDPPYYTNQSNITVGIKLPPDLSGIKKLYYKLGANPPTNSEKYLNPVIRNENTYSLCRNLVNANNTFDTHTQRAFSGEVHPDDWVDFCFTITPQVANQIYIWLEDHAGNNGYQAYIHRNLFIDRILPTAPQSLDVNVNPATTQDTLEIYWQKSTDERGIQSYYVCYWQKYAGFKYEQLQALPKGSCPQVEDILGRVSFKSPAITATGSLHETFRIPHTIPIGFWDVAIFAVDRSGNVSEFSPIYEFSVTGSLNYLDFISSHPSGLVHNQGSTLNYEFKIQYTNETLQPPQKAQLWIDLNGNLHYDVHEKLNMTIDNNLKVDNEVVFSEIYTLSKMITYQDNIPKIKYRFYFENENSESAIDGNTKGNPTASQVLYMDPYDPNQLQEPLQVRNNVVRNKGLAPAIVLQNPGSKHINLCIYDKSGRIVKILVPNRMYNYNEHRVIYWDLKTEDGFYVPSGIYRVVYKIEGKIKKMSSIIVMY